MYSYKFYLLLSITITIFLFLFFRYIRKSILSFLFVLGLTVSFCMHIVCFWNLNSTRLYVSFPSVQLFTDYIHKFGDTYYDDSVPFSTFDAFLQNEYKSYIFDTNETDGIKNADEVLAPSEDQAQNILWGENELSDFAEYIKGLFTDKVFSIVLTMFFLGFLLLCFHSLLIPRYCKKLKEQIGNYTHLWMGDNTLEDILISIDIVKNGTVKRSDLCTFMRGEIFDTNGCYFLTGQAGEGKSVALMRIALMVIGERRAKSFGRKDRQHKKIPVLLPIPEIDYTGKGKLDEQLSAKIIQIYREKLPYLFIDAIGHRLKNILKTYFIRGNIVVLFDGYDEVNENNRYQFISCLKKLMKLYPKCTYIVSSRTYVFNSDNYGFQEAAILNMSPLNKEQMYEFILKWGFTAESAKELYHKIATNYQLSHLSMNALLLTLICYLFDLKMELNPRSITDFYTAATACLLDAWESNKKIQKRVYVSLQVKQEALAAIAYYQLKTKQAWSSKEDLVKAIREVADRNGLLPEKIIEEISIQSGILETSRKNTYHFYHRSFHEYFAALHIVRNAMDSEIEELESEQHYNLITFYIAIKDDETITRELLSKRKENHQFVGYILSQCYINDNDFVLDYARTCLNYIDAQNISAFKKLGELTSHYPHIRPLVDKWISNTYSHTDDIAVKFNCIIAKTYYEDELEMAYLLAQDFSEASIGDLILLSDDTMDEIIFQYVKIDTNYLKSILDIIAGMRKYDLLFRMMTGSSDEKIKDIIFECFLNSTKETIFLEWMETKEFLYYEETSAQRTIQDYIRKYRWCRNGLSSVMIENFYVLVWHALQMLEDENHPFCLDKMDNGIKFIATYIKNVESVSQVTNYLIDIPGFKVNALIEFDYHWKKASKKSLHTFSKDPVVMTWIFSFTIVSTNILLMMYYIKNTCAYQPILRERYLLESRMAEIFRTSPETFQVLKGHDIANIQISKYTPFNGSYLLFSTAINLLQKMLHGFLAKYAFKMYQIVYHMLIAAMAVNVYFTMIQEMGFRAAFLLLSIAIMILGIIQHKNNYPSFKQPQFNLIRKYLKEERS